MSNVSPAKQSAVDTAQDKLVNDAKAGASGDQLSADIATLVAAQSAATPGTKISDEFSRISNFLKQEKVSSSGQSAVSGVLQSDLINSNVHDNKLDDLVKAIQAGIQTPSSASTDSASSGASGAPELIADNPPTPSGYTYQPNNNVNLFPNGAPSPDDVNQNAVGDCGLDATMAAFASTDPQAIQNAIKPNNTVPPSWAVTLNKPGGGTVTVNVDNQFPTTSSGVPLLSVGKQGEVTWSTVMEKAMAIYNTQYGNPLKGSNDGGAKYGKLDGVDSGQVMYAITGSKDAQNMGGEKISHTSDSDLATTISSALANGQAVTAASKQEGSEPISGIVGSHYYSVTSIKNVNGTEMVTVRNPWGVDPTTKNKGSPTGTDNALAGGYTTLTIDQFKTAFGSAGGWKDENGGDLYIAGKSATSSTTGSAVSQNNILAESMTSAMSVANQLPSSERSGAFNKALMAMVTSAGNGDLGGFQQAYSALVAAYPKAAAGDASNTKLELAKPLEAALAALGAGAVLKPDDAGADPIANPQQWIADAINTAAGIA